MSPAKVTTCVRAVRMTRALAATVSQPGPRSSFGTGLFALTASFRGLWSSPRLGWSSGTCSPSGNRLLRSVVMAPRDREQGSTRLRSDDAGGSRCGGAARQVIARASDNALSGPLLTADRLMLNNAVGVERLSALLFWCADRMIGVDRRCAMGVRAPAAKPTSRSCCRDGQGAPPRPGRNRYSRSKEIRAPLCRADERNDAIRVTQPGQRGKRWYRWRRTAWRSMNGLRAMAPPGGL